MPEPNQPTKEIVTVAEMSRMCGLSRSRFYQLSDEGIFPRPNRNPETGRPFFNQEQQEKCLQVRRTNLGINGRAVMFYAQQPRTNHLPKAKSTRIQPRKKQQTSRPMIDTLKSSLGELGMSNVSDETMQKALVEAYPDGLEKVSTPDLITMVYRCLKRQNSLDNLT